MEVRAAAPADGRDLHPTTPAGRLGARPLRWQPWSHADLPHPHRSCQRSPGSLTP